MRARSSMNVNAMSKAVSRPGIDPRIWVDKMVVLDAAVDPIGGIFCDVQSLDTGDKATAYLCSPYPGVNFGDYCPIEVGDTVIVAFPNGDTGSGGYIPGRYWDQSDTPNENFYTSAGPDHGKDPSPDRWIIMKPGTNIKIRTNEGGAVDIRCADNGDVNIVVDSGKVYLGDTTGTEPATKATTLKTYLDDIKLAFNTHTHSYLPGPGAATPTATPSGAFGAVPDIAADKVEVK